MGKKKKHKKKHRKQEPASALGVFGATTGTWDILDYELTMRELDGDLMKEAIYAAINQGVMITFVSTRARDAIGVNLFQRGAKARQYSSTVGELEESLRKIIERFGSYERPVKKGAGVPPEADFADLILE